MLSGQRHVSAKLPILTVPQIEALSLTQPYPGFDEGMMPLVNTKLWPDNSVLDAFLHKTLRDKLAAREIALMPTIRRVEPIGSELLLNMQNGEKLLYTTDISIANQEIVPILEEKLIKKGFKCAAWPVSVSNTHYGLFILSLTAVNGTTPARGFYIEPFNPKYMMQMLLVNMEASLRARLPRTLTGKQVKIMLSSYIYINYVQHLTDGLQMNRDSFECIFLGQSAGENYCSDYVIAVLARLASGDIDLNNPENLLSLQLSHLSEEMVKRIRMLEIQLFGDNYLMLQLPNVSPEATEASVLATGSDSKQTQQKVNDTEGVIQSVKRKNSDSTMAKGKRWCGMFPDAEENETEIATPTGTEPSEPQVMGSNNSMRP